MKITEIRLKNTRYLAASVGGIVALASKLGKSQQQVSHLIGRVPEKNIGHKIAKQIEQAFSKQEGWLDNVHTELYGEIPIEKEADEAVQDTEELPAEALEFARLWLELPSDQRAVLSNTAQAFMDSTKKQTGKVA